MNRLYVICGTPENVFPGMFKEWKVTLMTFESQIEPFNQRVDALVETYANQLNVKLMAFHSHTIYNPYSVLQSNNNEVPKRFDTFLALVETKNVAMSATITDKQKLKREHQPPKDSSEATNKSCYDLPELSELPLNEAELGPNKYPGGEQEALDRLDKLLAHYTHSNYTFASPNRAAHSIDSIVR